MERSSSQLYVNGWMGWLDRLDWIIIIGRRWSKSTFGTKKFKECVMQNNAKVVSKFQIFGWTESIQKVFNQTELILKTIGHKFRKSNKWCCQKKADTLRSATLALSISKCENFNPFCFTLWYSKHILFHCEGSQKCIFNAFNASAIPLSDRFVTEQQRQ